jgi:hypothetical protein
VPRLFLFGAHTNKLPTIPQKNNRAIQAHLLIPHTLFPIKQLIAHAVLMRGKGTRFHSGDSRRRRRCSWNPAYASSGSPRPNGFMTERPSIHLKSSLFRVADTSSRVKAVAAIMASPTEIFLCCRGRMPTYCPGNRVNPGTLEQRVEIRLVCFRCQSWATAIPEQIG